MLPGEVVGVTTLEVLQARLDEAWWRCPSPWQGPLGLYPLTNLFQPLNIVTLCVVKIKDCYDYRWLFCHEHEHSARNQYLIVEYYHVLPMLLFW